MDGFLPNRQPISVFLASDRQILVDSLCACFAAAGGLAATPTVGSDDEAFRMIQTIRPDVILLDSKRISIAERLRASSMNSPIIVLFMGTLSSVNVTHVVKIGVQGCLAARQSAKTLIEVIKRVAQGETFFSEEIRQHLKYDPVKKRFDTKHDGQLAQLSQRQLQVVRLLAEGKTLKEAARLLHVSRKAIENHRYRIGRKLGVKNGVELSRLAIREGLISP